MTLQHACDVAEEVSKKQACMAAETEQWLTGSSSSRSKQILHALGGFALLQNNTEQSRQSVKST